jgi:hypothetical protein
MVIHHAISGGGHDAIEPPDALRGRIHYAFQEWADESHLSGMPDVIVTSGRLRAASHTRAILEKPMELGVAGGN